MYRKILVATTLIIFLITSPALSHPGRTDSSGGHHVRTPGWGYPVGSYHYHNGGYSGSYGSGGSSSNYNKKSTKKKTSKKATLKKKLIIAVDLTGVKAYPDLNSYDLVGITYGYEIKDLGGTPGWKTVNHGGYQGYISNSVVAQYTVITPKTITIKAYEGYLFYGPSANKCKTRLTEGTTITAIGQVDKWYYVKYIDDQGLIKYAFVSSTVAW